MLSVGDKAPPFRAVDQAGQEIASEDLLSRGPIVLYFYPKDFTPVCTREACHFRDAHEDLVEKGAQVVGVSTDTEQSHRSFADKHRLNFPLLSDADKQIARAYDALNLLGGTKRVTYVIDRSGLVRGVFHHELRAKKHVDQVQDLLTRL